MNYCSPQAWNMQNTLQECFVKQKSKLLSEAIIKLCGPVLPNDFKVVDLASGTSLLAHTALSILYNKYKAQISYTGIDMDQFAINHLAKKLDWTQFSNVSFKNESIFEVKYEESNLYMCLENTFLATGDLEDLNQFLHQISKQKDVNLILSIIPSNIDSLQENYEMFQDWLEIPNSIPKLQLQCRMRKSNQKIAQDIKLRYLADKKSESFCHSFYSLSKEEVTEIIEKNGLKIVDWFSPFETSENNSNESPLEYYILIKGNQS
jgi:hypothetical protein